MCLKTCGHVVFGYFPLEVWSALLKEMPLQSVLRILGKMTSKKILEPGGSETQAVCDRIQSETALKKVGRVGSLSLIYSCVFNQNMRQCFSI